MTAPTTAATLPTRRHRRHRARPAPDVIVNAAAHTAVDKAESEPELARLLNATTPGVLAARPPPWAPGWCTTAPTTCSTAAAPALGRDRHPRP
jgi:hypothetical protein